MSDRPLQSLPLRQATVTTLRADGALGAVGTPALADRIYGKRQPATLTWPFVRVSVADEVPLRKGTDIRATVHTFSKGKFDDECENLNSAVQGALENAVLDLGNGNSAYFAWKGSQVLPDPVEASAWHGVNSFTATIG